MPSSSRHNGRQEKRTAAYLTIDAASYLEGIITILFYNARLVFLSVATNVIPKADMRGKSDEWSPRNAPVNKTTGQ